MKTILFLSFSLLASTAFGKTVTVTGLKAKAVYDTLASNKKLEMFTDATMGGHRYFTSERIDCSKSTVTGKESEACTFNTTIDGNPSYVSFYSDIDGGAVSEMRYVLSQASKAERKRMPEMKELSIKSLSCEASGVGFVLDGIDIELGYKCIFKI